MKIETLKNAELHLGVITLFIVAPFFVVVSLIIGYSGDEDKEKKEDSTPAKNHYPDQAPIGGQI